MAIAQAAARTLRQYLVAVQYFTRLPVTGPLAQWVGYTPQLLRESAAHFPGVGWLAGIVACAAAALLAAALPSTPYTPMVAAVGATFATVLLTGAFHEDGLADLADGLGGSLDRERALEIMKDSRVGSFGAIALVLALLAKVALLSLLAAASWPAMLCALLAAHAVSRFWPLLVIRTLAHVGDEGTSKSKPLADRIGAGALLVGAAWCSVPLAIAGLAQGPRFAIGAVLASAIGFLLLRGWLARRLQGFTGDGLGATQQACEIAFYLGAAMALGGPA